MRPIAQFLLSLLPNWTQTFAKVRDILSGRPNGSSLCQFSNRKWHSNPCFPTGIWKWKVLGHVCKHARFMQDQLNHHLWLKTINLIKNSLHPGKMRLIAFYVQRLHHLGVLHPAASVVYFPPLIEHQHKTDCAKNSTRMLHRHETPQSLHLYIDSVLQSQPRD